MRAEKYMLYFLQNKYAQDQFKNRTTQIAESEPLLGALHDLKSSGRH